MEEAAVVVAEVLSAGCMIALLSDDEQTMFPIGLHPSDSRLAEAIEARAEISFPAAGGYIGQALATGLPVVEQEVTAESLRAVKSTFVDLAERAGVNSLLALPLTGRTGMVGAMVLARSRQEGGFEPADIAFAQHASTMVALAVESALLAEALEAATGRRAAPRLHPPDRGGHRRAESALGDLTEREREILGKLRLGLTNREVAERLVLSVRTIEWYRSRIQSKLGVSSRAELIEVARAYGLVDPPGAQPGHHGPQNPC